MAESKVNRDKRPAPAGEGAAGLAVVEVANWRAGYGLSSTARLRQNPRCSREPAVAADYNIAQLVIKYGCAR